MSTSLDLAAGDKQEGLSHKQPSFAVHDAGPSLIW